MINEHLRSQLHDLIATKAIQFGDFTLASGKKSSYYLDLRKITTTVEGIYLIGRIGAELCDNSGVHAIGGMETGAIPIVTAILAQYPIWQKYYPDGFWVRKAKRTHGTQRLIEGNPKVGSRVALVEDVVTTGDSLIKCIDAVEKELFGYVHVIMTIVSRGKEVGLEFSKRNITYIPIFTVQDFGLPYEN